MELKQWLEENKIDCNCVFPPLGKYVFDCAFKNIQTKILENKNEETRKDLCDYFYGAARAKIMESVK